MRLLRTSIADATRIRTDSGCRSRTSGPKRSEEAPGRKKPGKSLTSFSYLPATFTTLFFLAASLLLGYTH
jgi:hypothetical protein